MNDNFIDVMPLLNAILHYFNELVFTLSEIKELILND